MAFDPRTSQRPTRQRLDEARHEIRLAAELALRAEMKPPPKHLRLRRVAYGLSLPIGLLRRVWRDPSARKAYLRVVVPQLAFVVGVAFLLFGVWHGPSRDDDDDGPTSFPRLMALGWLVVTVLTVLGTAEWIVIAFSREHHDYLSYCTAKMTGVPHEAPTAPPRVRLDIPWLWTKGKRKLRALSLTVIALPALALVGLVPHVGKWLSPVLAFLWSAYWVAVFTLGGTSLAWHPAPAPREPFFLRGLDPAARVPVFGWIVRLYIRMARWISSPIHHACQALEEEAPYEAMGLAVTRFVFGLPGLYLVTRPLMTVAATHALLSRRYAGTDGTDGTVGSTDGATPETSPFVTSETGSDGSAFAKTPANAPSDSPPLPDKRDDR